MSGLFTGGDVLALLAVARQLGRDGQEAQEGAARVGRLLAAVGDDLAPAVVLAPARGARVAATAAVCEASLPA